jgi:predicted transcriptional regulator
MLSVKSVRMDPALQGRLKQAAQHRGVSESEFIRAAIAERIDATLADNLDVRLAGLVGTVHSKGGRARQAHERYRNLLRRRVARTQKSRP